MEALLLYLLKSAGILSIFFAAYVLLLRNDTSFTTNRVFLLLGIFTSFLLPAVIFTRIITVEAPVRPVYNDAAAFQEAMTVQATAISTDWQYIVAIGYMVVTGALVLRLLIGLLSLRKFLRKSNRRTENGFIFLTTRENVTPFSFFKFIVYNPQVCPPGEMEMILQHEKVHASQWHSIDVLVAHVASAMLWFNPLIWLYKGHMLQNLEYLADRKTAEAASCTKEYQKALLQISAGDLQPRLVNHFYQSLIKKRIIMLNKKTTSGKNVWKTGIVLPFLLAFILGFQVKTEARIISGNQPLQDSTATKSEFAVTINSQSTKESLAALEEVFSNRGVSLSFSNIKQTAKGKITHIEASFQTASGQLGNYHQTNSNGITPFTFYTKGNVETGFRAASVPDSPTSLASGYGPLQKIGTRPLVILSGKEYKTEDLYGKHIQLLKGFEVLSPEETLSRLGKDSRDGTLLIPEGQVIADFEAAMKKLDTEADGVDYDYLQFSEGIKPSFVNVRKTANRPTGSGHRDSEENRISKTATATGDPIPFDEKWKEAVKYTADIIATQYGKNSNQVFVSSLSQKPLVVLDGKIQDPDFNIDSIDPASIKSIRVLNTERATEKYGEKGKNGVIEITLRKAGEATGSDRKISGEGTGKTTGTVSISSGEKSSTAKATTISINAKGRNSSDEAERLYVVDGKEMNEGFKASSIRPQEIEKIMVITGDKAVEKYGTKASEGVIEITTKKE